MISNTCSILEKCCVNYAYEDLSLFSNSEGMRQLYNDVKNVLKKYYYNSDNLSSYFVNPANKKYCYVKDAIDFGGYELEWNDAARAVYAVYADCPIFFFVDKYKVGGSPEKKTIAPVVDYEYRRGDVRQFYAEIIENEIKVISKGVIDYNSFEKARYVYDYISNSADYDYVKGSTNYVDTPSHSIVGYVRNGSAVCQGLSETYQIIMNYLKVPTITIHGMMFNDDSVKEFTGYHSRNLLFIREESRWIMVDVTTGVSSKRNTGFDISSEKCSFRQIYESEKTMELHRFSPNYDKIWNDYFQSN